MIPIRNFPYTDYHDLNLDFLLRQIQIFEADLEELKRRVKALEDWRIDIVEPDLLTIKGDIVNIKANIISLGDRITTVEGNTTILKNNSKTYVIYYNGNEYVIKQGSISGPEVTDFDTFIEDIRGASTSTYGNKIVNLLIGSVTGPYYRCEYSYLNGVLSVTSVEYNEYFRRWMDIKTHLFTIDSTGIIDHTIVSNDGFTNDVQLLLIQDLDEAQSTYIPSIAADYPYYLRIPNARVTPNTIIDIYIVNGETFNDVSDFLCDYVATGNEYFDIFMKSNVMPVAAPIRLNYVLTGE